MVVQVSLSDPRPDQPLVKPLARYFHITWPPSALTILGG